MRSACSPVVRRLKETVGATLKAFVALQGVAAALTDSRHAVAAVVAATLGCDWRLPGKAPGVADKWSTGLRVAAQLGPSDCLSVMRATRVGFSS